MEAYVETNDYENIMMTLATILPGLMIKIWHQSLICQKSNTLIIGNDEKNQNCNDVTEQNLS